MATSKSMDMTTGPFYKKIILFAIPLMLTGVLQIIYNAADSIVVGRFVGHQALAAVSSTGSLCQLIISLFMGMAVGSGVIVAKFIGAKRENAISRALHTAMIFGFICGIVIMIIGLLVSRQALILMGSPEDILDLSTLYLQIYFLGSPGNLTYNFGAAILRSKGDTKRPLIILSVAGIINVLLNLVLVLVFHMTVEGVAIATIAAQYISAIWVVILLMKEEGSLKLDLKKLRFHKDELIQIIRIGLPAGIQSVCFALSNVIIQSAIYSFGSTVVAGCAAAVNIDNILYLVANSLTQAAMTFSSQNMGAQKYENLNKVYGRCLIINTITLAFLSTVAMIFSSKIVGIFSSEPDVVSAGVQRTNIAVPLYFMCGLMDIAGGQLRGMGYSFNSMIITLLGSCVFRLLWIFTVVTIHHTILMVYIIYPISWVVTSIALNTMIFVLLKKLKKKTLG